jgi:hypothetical protein
VRIAFSGSHRVGKSTLLERVADVVGGHTTIDEPYHLEAQLERSLAEIEEGEPNQLFDRCPVDLLAYLLALDEEFDAGPWLETVRAAMSTIDLVVYLPIEAAGPVVSHEDADFRRAVDDKLRELLIDDVLDLEIEVLTVGGDLRSRVAQVVAHMR